MCVVRGIEIVQGPARRRYSLQRDIGNTEQAVATDQYGRPALMAASATRNQPMRGCHAII